MSALLICCKIAGLSRRSQSDRCIKCTCVLSVPNRSHSHFQHNGMTESREDQRVIITSRIYQSLKGRPTFTVHREVLHVHARAHTHTHTYTIHTHARARAHTHTHTHTHTYTHTTHTNAPPPHTHMQTHIHTLLTHTHMHPPPHTHTPTCTHNKAGKCNGNEENERYKHKRKNSSKQYCSVHK